MLTESNSSPVYFRSCGGGQSRVHSHRWPCGVCQCKWFLSTWKGVHLPGLPLWPAASTIRRLQLEPDYWDIPTSQLFRSHQRSHSGNRARFAAPLDTESAADLCFQLCAIMSRVRRLLSECWVVETPCGVQGLCDDCIDGSHPLSWGMPNVLVLHGGKRCGWT